MAMNLDRIKITHFVNPHLFWFITEPSDKSKKQVRSLEKKIKTFIEVNPQPANLSYENGDFVAVYYIPKERYVRAFVDQLLNDYTKNYIVWLMDYGIPLLTVSSVIRRIPAEFCVRIDHVLRGGLANIVPITKELDDFLQPVVKFSENWCERSIKTFKELFNDFQNTLYINKLYQQHATGHIWFELIIDAKTGKQLNAGDLLIEMKLGKSVDGIKFMSICRNLKSLQQVPWTTVTGTNNYTVNELVNYEDVSPIDIQDEPYWDDVSPTSKKKEEEEKLGICHNKHALPSEIPPAPKDADFDMNIDLWMRKLLLNGKKIDDNVQTAQASEYNHFDVKNNSGHGTTDNSNAGADFLAKTKIQEKTKNYTSETEASKSFATATG